MFAGSPCRVSSIGRSGRFGEQVDSRERQPIRRGADFAIQDGGQQRALAAGRAVSLQRRSARL